MTWAVRVLVCGGRDYADRQHVFREMDRIAGISETAPLGRNITIIHGACRTGADQWADEWAVLNWKQIDEFPADWQTHGRAAGPIRNQRMIDEGRPDLVVAFPGGSGTADMVRRAEKAGIPVSRPSPSEGSR